MLQLVLELVKGFLHRPTPDQLPGLPRVETVVQRRAREVGPGESSDHIFFPSRQSFQHPFCRFGVRLHARSGRATRDEAEEISDRIVPDIRKGSDEAPHVAKRRQFPSPFTGCPVRLALKVDEQELAVRTAPEHLGQVQIGVDDAFHAAHACLEAPQCLLDLRAKVEEVSSGLTGRFRECRFVPASELAESPQSRSEGSSGRLERVAEILLRERLGVPRSRMTVDEGLMQGGRGPAEV